MNRYFKHYMSLARPDHWVKNIFIFPGLLFSYLYGGSIIEGTIYLNLIFVFLSVCFSSSANYTINEWLDREFDKNHPTKKERVSVVFDLDVKLVYLQYFILVLLSLTTSIFINSNILYANIALLIMGLVYNVKPLRTKELPFFDVLSESINNPIRFLIGWFILDNTIYPPSSILIAYWMGGAFLMSSKRFAEYRKIKDKIKAVNYRKSFKYYNENLLMSSSIFYALNSISLTTIFIMKYKKELFLLMPFLAILFSYYSYKSFKHDSSIDAPEKLYKDYGLITIVIFTVLAFFVLNHLQIEFINSIFYAVEYGK